MPFSWDWGNTITAGEVEAVRTFLGPHRRPYCHSLLFQSADYSTRKARPLVESALVGKDAGNAFGVEITPSPLCCQEPRQPEKALVLCAGWLKTVCPRVHGERLFFW